MKTTHPSSFLVSLVLAILSLGLLSGCAGKKSSAPPKKGPGYKYDIMVDVSLNGQTFTVDVIGVNSSNKDRITGMSVDDYFNDKDKLRSGTEQLATKKMSSSEGAWRVDIESKENEKYSKIRYPGFSHIAIIADSNVRGSNPANDQRRILLPLNPALWPDSWPRGEKRTITVTFGSAGVQSSPGALSQ